MRARRFKVDDLGSDLIRVAGAEARHALVVLRLTAGAEVVLFDGQGHEALGRVETIRPAEFDVRISSSTRQPAETRGGLILAAATPKGPRGDWMVEKCAELGVAELWPLRCERGEVLPSDGKLERWRRKAVQAAKQSGSATALRVVPPRTVEQALAARPESAILLYGDPQPSARPLIEWLNPESEPSGDCMIFIGPEGGFTGRESALLDGAGARPLRWAGAILRVETAAIAAAAVWAACAAVRRGG